MCPRDTTLATNISVISVSAIASKAKNGDRIARELDREIATPDEARQILELKRKDKVSY